MEEQQEKSYHQKKYIWYILTLSLFNYFGATAWDVIFPDIVTRANGTVSLWGYAYAAFNITKFIFQIPNANLSDKIGRSKVISLCLFLFGIGSTLVLWAYEPWILILARALQGAGAVSAVFLAAISDYSKGKDKGMIVAGRNLSQTLGWILGMMAGGIVAEYFGLRVAIILCVLIGFIGGGIAFFLVDEGDKKNIVESGSNSNSEDPQKKNWLKITLKIPEYKYGLLFGSLRYFLYQAIVTYTLWFLAEEWEVAGSKRVLYLLPVIVFYIVGLFTAGKLTGNKNRNLFFIVSGFLIVSIGSFVISTINNDHDPLKLISMLAIISVGLGFAHTTLTTTMVKNLPPKYEGSALGFAMTINFAFIVAAPLMMSESSVQWDPIAPYLVVSVLSLIISLFALFMGKSKMLKKL